MDVSEFEKHSKIHIQPITLSFSVCRVKEMPESLLNVPYCFLETTPEEKSLVCPTPLVPSDTLLREDGWRGFYIKGVLDFSLIGILAGISAVLAEHQIGIFVISTYNTDYVWVKENHYMEALDALKKEGYLILEKSL